MQLLDGAVTPEDLAGQARSHLATGDIPAALTCYESALLLVREEGDGAAQAELLRMIGNLHRQAGENQAALSCYEESLALAEASDVPEAIARALNCMGAVAQLRGDVDLAVRYYMHSRAVAESIAAVAIVASIDLNLGILANIRGHLDTAITNYMSARAGFEATGNRHGTASVLNNLGMLYTELQQWPQAELALDDGFIIAHELRDAMLLGKIELNRANLHIKRRSFDSARECCDQAFEICSRASDAHGLADTYIIYGVLFHAMQRPHLAYANLNTAIEMARGCEDVGAEADAYRNLALVHLGEQRNVEALECLNAAHPLFQRLNATTALSEVENRLDGLERTYLQVVESWAESIEAMDRYTAGHCGRVADYAVQLASACGFTGRDLTWFRMGGFLHDVGKTGVPVEVLNKPGKLTDEEFQQMQAHTTIGDAIVAPLNFPWDIRPLVRSHHEKWDGTGYPDRLKGEDIPLAARILCVADVYDALTSARSYRPALSQNEAFKIMDRESGTTLDPGLYAKFCSIMIQSHTARATAVEPSIAVTVAASHATAPSRVAARSGPIRIVA